MTQYVKSTSFTSKDTLPSGNPLKILKGTEIDVEFDSIAIAVNSKADLFSAALTGTPTAPTAVVGTATTQLATTAFATAGITPFTGAMLMWPKAAPPTGFLVCNGQAVSRATYAALFAVLGTVFGVGDGSTTFTLPNYIDRMPVGVGSSFSVNQKGGSFDSTLPSHTHSATVNDSGHSHPLNGQAIQGNISTAPSALTDNDARPLGTQTQTAFTGITVTNAPAGVSPSFGNMTPFIGMYFIIKT
jgi:microcystin-dependent protein